MTGELDTFRRELRAAGQPYSLWGGRVVGLGLAVLVVIQALGMAKPELLMRFGLLLSALCVVVLAVGWIMLIIAFVRRRRWAKAHPLREPQLPDAS